MSFPSTAAVAAELGLDLRVLSDADAERVLVGAMKRDCPEAVNFLHGQAHKLGEFWSLDPNSPLGRQVIRLCASDATRPLVEKHFCHGEPIAFYNCCNGVVGPKPKTVGDVLRMQIECQAGPRAYADC